MSTLDSPSESFIHKSIKQLIFKYVPKNSSLVEESRKEKVIAGHRADVFFKLRNGKRVAVEIQQSKMTVREINQRNKDYADQGIHVLWILAGGGSIAASPRNLIHRKDVKVSSAEMRLHSLYQGRVYYVSLREKDGKITISTPFAAHFSHPSNHPPARFKEGYETLYYRNVNCTKIPSWDLLCTKSQGFKIARFYDKHFKNTLRKKILKFISEYFGGRKDFSGYWKTRKVTKRTFKQFNDLCGAPLLLDCLLELQEKGPLKLGEKTLIRRRHKYVKKSW